jgi:micrococcal nuclease
MKRLKTKIIASLMTLLMGALVSAYTGYVNQQSNKIETRAEQTQNIPGLVKVTEVIDGDTFKIDTGDKVRMIGMDTPEVHHPTKPVQCFGKEAMAKTKELLENKYVRLEKDVSSTDRYGRLLRFVYLANLSPTPLPASQSAELFVNEYLLQEGYARILTVPPDVRESEHFRVIQNIAMNAQKGLWKTCK